MTVPVVTQDVREAARSLAASLAETDHAITEIHSAGMYLARRDATDLNHASEALVVEAADHLLSARRALREVQRITTTFITREERL